MCGIFCALNSDSENNCDVLISQLTFEQNIKKRGPDKFDFKVITTKHGNLSFAASVLWLQGNDLTGQPIEDDDSVFCYNGDIFAGFSDTLQQEKGDTQLFLDFLKQGKQTGSFLSLQQLQGPYAFIFFDKLNEKLYFARDHFGRRSLLLGQNKEGDTLILTSVAKRQSRFDFVEVPAVGIFCFDIVNKKFTVECWKHGYCNFDKLVALESFLQTDIVCSNRINNSALAQDFAENDNYVFLKSITSTDPNAIFDSLLNRDSWIKNVEILKQLLKIAVLIRIRTQPPYCTECLSSKTVCFHATTGVLFSGGVDCAVLAAICNECVDENRPIDLLNVSFDESGQFISPDRTTGLQTLEELKRCYPKRKWNFIEVNISKEQLDLERDHQIADLIYPLNTILDDSLGCALWFASRGKTDVYTSSCRTLIVGMGADELFGGYTRHRTAFQRNSLQGLQKTLDDDWLELPYRNLGRDDRVVSDHGRQLRTPFLDENVVKFVRGLKCWERSFPSKNVPQGVGEKILLRTLAYQLGLKKAASLKKRALQFGSRIANSKENGHEVSPRLGF